MTMTKKERLIFLIQTLLKESPEYQNTPHSKKSSGTAYAFSRSDECPGTKANR